MPDSKSSKLNQCARMSCSPFTYLTSASLPSITFPDVGGVSSTVTPSDVSEVWTPAPFIAFTVTKYRPPFVTGSTRTLLTDVLDVVSSVSLTRSHEPGDKPAHHVTRMISLSRSSNAFQ